MGASTLPNRFEYTLHCSVKRRALVCAIFVLAWLLCGSNVSATSMGKNDHGFPRSGPIEPRAYPDSVSVVVPCFNCGEFVLQALESFERGFEVLHEMIEAQGLPPVACDVVIVDDKSTDESVKIMRRFVNPSSVWGGKACAECARPPPQYTIIEHKKNRVSRNDGVAAARGNVIFFGEADDVFYEHHIATCWDQLRQHPHAGFAKMRMDAGHEYLGMSFVFGDAPVQKLHPHWQVAIEDTSPMNLCVRREAHEFIRGFPDGELFHMDMEDGAYMMGLYEAYGGVKWLGPPSTLYVRREGNGLDRRMLQFTSEPGTVPLPEQDEKHGDDRFDLIDGLLAVLRDAVVEYHALDELLLAEAASPALPAAEAIAHLPLHPYPLIRPGAPDGGAGAPWVVLLVDGCSPHRLRATLSRLLYGPEPAVSPLRLSLLLRAPGNRLACRRARDVARLFPVHLHNLSVSSTHVPGGSLSEHGAGGDSGAAASLGGALGVELARAVGEGLRMELRDALAPGGPGVVVLHQLGGSGPPLQGPGDTGDVPEDSGPIHGAGEAHLWGQEGACRWALQGLESAREREEFERGGNGSADRTAWPHGRWSQPSRAYGAAEGWTVHSGRSARGGKVCSAVLREGRVAGTETTDNSAMASAPGTAEKLGGPGLGQRLGCCFVGAG